MMGDLPQTTRAAPGSRPLTAPLPNPARQALRLTLRQAERPFDPLSLVDQVYLHILAASCRPPYQSPFVGNRLFAAR